VSVSYSPTPTPTAPAPAKSSGCLKWGLIGCGAALVLFLGFVAVIVLVVFGAIKRSDVYREALRRVQNDPAVTAALGTPIDAGIYVTGNVNLDTSGGHAKFDFPVSGPKGKADVHAVATMNGSKWEYSELTVTPANGPLINLQPSQPATSTETTTTTGTTTGTEATTSTQP
jgi:Cytochrome oxidase complex assembly protein 1